MMLYYIGLILIVSLFTYGLYGIDKYKSIKGSWRIKESTLFLATVCFGALGGLIAMYQFRHKTKHPSFVIINFLSLSLHVALGFILWHYQII